MKSILHTKVLLVYSKMLGGLIPRFSFIFQFLFLMLLSMELSGQCLNGSSASFDRSNTDVSTICTSGAAVVDGTEPRPEIAAEVGSIAPLVAGDILIQAGAIQVTDAMNNVIESFDVKLEIIEVYLGDGDSNDDDNFLMLDGNNSLSLENVSPADNPYVLYKYTILEPGTFVCGGSAGTPATLLGVNVDINDIDSNHDPTGPAQDDGVLSGTASDGIPDLGTQGADENFTDIGGALNSDGATSSAGGAWLGTTTSFTMAGAANASDYTLYQVDPSAVNQNGNDDWLDDINNRGDDVFPSSNSEIDFTYANFSCGTFMFGVTGPEENDKDRGNSFGLSGIVTESCLPVELLSFDAKSSSDHVNLTWSTASEIDNEYFDLERSENGKNYKPITRIEGQGTRIKTTAYNYEDTQITPNTLYYYRLKQVDFNGNYEYSDVITTITNKESISTKVFPNPTEEVLVLVTATDFNQIEVLDITGRVVMVSNFDAASRIELNVSPLTPGTYFALLKNNQTRDIIRFMKK